MSSAGTVLDAIRKIRQNRALARRRRAILRQQKTPSFGNLDYKRDPNRLELTPDEKLAVKDKMRKEIAQERIRDYVFLGLFVAVFLSAIWYYIFS